MLIDTHVLIWWLNGDDTLGAQMHHAIDRVREAGALRASAISAWEISLLVAKGRLELTLTVDDWLTTAAAIDGFAFHPVNWQIATAANRLGGNFHPDPADRMIVATALHLGIPLATADQRIIDYPHVETLMAR